jgi:hypothetical protein
MHVTHESSVASRMNKCFRMHLLFEPEDKYDNHDVANHFTQTTDIP